MGTSCRVHRKRKLVGNKVGCFLMMLTLNFDLCALCLQKEGRQQEEEVA